MINFYEKIPTDETLWRSIILFGRNVATYKFALGKALIELAEKEKTFIRLEELAEPFSRHICDHLKIVDKQGTFSRSRFLDVCRQYNESQMDKNSLIEKTAELGFANVIDAFHIVGSGEIPKRFFVDERKHRQGITITDDLLALKANIQFMNFPYEVEARWRLVETAWSLNINPHMLMAKYDEFSNLIFVEGTAKRRINVTSCKDSFNGYQKGKCFYCFKDIIIDGSESDRLTDVDHFFPHVVGISVQDLRFNINGVWNLVLSCKDCNRGVQGKFDSIPSLSILERLHRRNEFFIQSHHPLRETIVNQTGATPQDRINFMNEVDKIAYECRPHRWEPQNEYAPAF